MNKFNTIVPETSNIFNKYKTNPIAVAIHNNLDKMPHTIINVVHNTINNAFMIFFLLIYKFTIYNSIIKFKS